MPHTPGADLVPHNIEINNIYTNKNKKQKQNKTKQNNNIICTVYFTNKMNRACIYISGFSLLGKYQIREITNVHKKALPRGWKEIICFGM